MLSSTHGFVLHRLRDKVLTIWNFLYPIKPLVGGDKGDIGMQLICESLIMGLPGSERNDV